MKKMIVLSMLATVMFVGPWLSAVFAQDWLISGSGFLVDPQGYILTAEHVVADVGSKKRVAIEVIVGGKEKYQAQVVKIDKKNDLALLKIKGTDLPIVTLGRADTAKRQEPVWVIGFPLGYQDISTASGRITAFRINAKLIDDDREMERLIETDARVNVGSSGGPLVNNRAEAIGVVHAKIHGKHVERTGFAIPLNLAIPLLEAIPGFDKSNLGKGTREFSGMEVDTRVTPAVVQIKIKVIPEEDVFKESLERVKQLQQKALQELQVKGIRLPDRMVLIPEGKFIMGSNEGEEDEKPEYSVYLDAYFIDKFEVTTSQYGKFLQEIGRKKPTYWWTETTQVDHGDRPVFGVSWYDAKEFCQHYGKRLPTEAEWEKAARGTEGWEYPWGDDPAPYRKPTKGNYSISTHTIDHEDVYGTALMPVGSYENGMSPYGVYDLAGNVSEWVEDWYGEKYYKDRPAKNPKGPPKGSSKVLRGGSWVGNIQSTTRLGLSPDFKNLWNGGGNGFRCAKHP